MNKECTLSDKELIDKCNQWVYKLAETKGNAWVLRVPVDFNNDPDILFVELGKRLEAKHLIIQLSKEFENKIELQIKAAFLILEHTQKPQELIIKDLTTKLSELIAEQSKGLVDALLQGIELVKVLAFGDPISVDEIDTKELSNTFLATAAEALKQYNKNE